MQINDTGKNNKIEVHPTANVETLQITMKGDNNTIKIGAGSIIKHFHINMSHGSTHTVEIGSEITLHGGVAVFEYDENSLFIGNQCNLYSGLVLKILEANTCISIGQNCLFSESVMFRTGDSHCIYDMATKLRINHPHSIWVGNHVWICEHVKILKGALVDNDSVIGVGSIVTGKRFAPNSLIVGTPAKVVKTNINWRPEIV
jgi:acetyltransferase-like isoleucine patch superfamily enzyme